EGPTLGKERLHLRDDRARDPYGAVVPLRLVASISEPSLVDAESSRVADPAVDDHELAVRAPPEEGIVHRRSVVLAEHAAGFELLAQGSQLAPLGVGQQAHLD